MLERDGLIARHVTGDARPRSQCQLTALGLGTYRQFHRMVERSESATRQIRLAHRDYDLCHPALAD